MYSSLRLKASIPSATTEPPFFHHFHVINTAREHLKGKTIVLIEKYELKAEETKPEASESNAEGSSNQE